MGEDDGEGGLSLSSQEPGDVAGDGDGVGDLDEGRDVAWEGRLRVLRDEERDGELPGLARAHGEPLEGGEQGDALLRGLAVAVGAHRDAARQRHAHVLDAVPGAVLDVHAQRRVLSDHRDLVAQARGQEHRLVGAPEGQALAPAVGQRERRE